MDTFPILERVNAIISYYKMSDRAFAIRCGIKQPTLDKQTKGQRALSLETINAILNTFGDISAEWLLRGEGSMIKGEAPSKDLDRLNKLVDTIATLQDVINDKSASLTAALERIRQLESQLK